MFVAYVWPFRELRKSGERKTFFWLECTHDEAIEVLAQVQLSAEDFRSYVNHLDEFRTLKLDEQYQDEWRNVYSRIGFLISEDGKNVEWAPPGYPISNMWNVYNPFLPMGPFESNTFADFNLLAQQFAEKAPGFSNLNDQTEIASRFDFAKFRGEDPNNFLSAFVLTSELAEVAVKIFYDRYCQGAEQKERKFFDSDISAQWHLWQKREELIKDATKNQNLAKNSKVSAIDFSQVSLSELFARKRRALENLQMLENGLSGEGNFERGYPTSELKALSDDEVCELAILMERYTFSSAIKWIYEEFVNRLLQLPLSMQTLLSVGSSDERANMVPLEPFDRCSAPFPGDKRPEPSLSWTDLNSRQDPEEPAKN
jgi:hypothetical protein